MRSASPSWTASGRKEPRGTGRDGQRSTLKRVDGKRQVHDHFLEVAARAQGVEDGIAADLIEVAMSGHEGAPQCRDCPLRARLALGGPDRSFASRRAPEDVRAGQVV